MCVSGICLERLLRSVLSGPGAGGFTAQHRLLADEGEVVVPTGGVGDSSAAVGRDVQLSRVGDGTTVDSNRAAPGVTDTDGITSIATAVDVADGDHAAVGRRRRNSAIARRGDVAGACIAATKELALEVLDARLG